MNRSHFTEAFSKRGRVIKNRHLVKSFRLKGTDYETVSFLTWQCSRFVRRDFYWLTSRLFHVSKNPLKRARIRNVIHDLRREVSDIEAMGEGFALPEDRRMDDEMDLIVITEEARDILYCLRDLDEVLCRLLHADEAEDFLTDKCELNLASFYELRKCMGGRKQPEKTAIS